MRITGAWKNIWHESEDVMKKVSIMLMAFLLLACSKNEEAQKPLVCLYEPDPVTVVSFSGVGDNLIHETVYLDALTSSGSYDFTKMYEDVADDMKKSDIAFINQETVLGGSELGLSGYPSFNSPSEIALNLKESGFNLVNLATNHTLDRGLSGIINELNTFSSIEDMVVDGAYMSQEAYDTIVTFEVEGITFSFLAYTYGTNGIIPEYSYEVSYFDDEQITRDVQRAKEISDVVIVSAHWGDENSFVPNSFQRHYAQLFADLGVDVVIGTHPHVIQPVEWVMGETGNQTLVVYSLGNFIGGMLTTNNAIGGMIQFDFIKNEEDIYIDHVKWVPLMIHFEGNQANINAERYHYKSYKVENYTDELASKHVLNGYEGNVVSLDYIYEITHQVIDASFLE